MSVGWIFTSSFWSMKWKATAAKEEAEVGKLKQECLTVGCIWWFLLLKSEDLTWNAEMQSNFSLMEGSSPEDAAREFLHQSAKQVAKNTHKYFLS